MRRRISIRHNLDGSKTITETFIRKTITGAKKAESFVRKVPARRSGCYVATCVYGSYDCPEVWTLRRYRDTKLSKSFLGRAFIRFYYAVSPSFVKLFGKTKMFNFIFKKKLDRIVLKLNENGFDNTPYKDKQW